MVWVLGFFQVEKRFFSYHYVNKALDLTRLQWQEVGMDCTTTTHGCRKMMDRAAQKADAVTETQRDPVPPAFNAPLL